MQSAVVIAVAGQSAWIELTSQLLSDVGYKVVAWESGADGEPYIRWLTDLFPALLLIDGDAPGWALRVTTPKVQQATRRIPILVMASDPASEPEAIKVGADGFISMREIETGLVAAVDGLARRMVPEQVEALNCACAEELPPLARQAVDQFNAGEYYHQHDLFEAQWMAETGPVRELYRVVLQVGVAYYHITQGNYRGALRMLQRSVQWFVDLPDVCQGINLRQLRDDAAHVRAVLEATGSFDPALLQPLRLVDD